ncbi:MAG: hypothetical protein IPG99_16405 [Ignavibacteria bacterium]|nr:hypothetical protein [Ignavibacteria bacterium]
MTTLFETKSVELPTTINPTQTPKLVAAGIALSPYLRNTKYSETEARTRYLWLEFDNLPLDKHDDLFCRVLAYSPDQLISNNSPSLMKTPFEPPLSLDPEYIRVVTPDSGHDHNGLDAMQRMQNQRIQAGIFTYCLCLKDCIMKAKNCSVSLLMNFDTVTQTKYVALHKVDLGGNYA